MNSNFFDSFKEVMTDAAQTVAQKSGELIDASKTKYAIFELKGEIKKLYAKIGKSVYRSYSDGFDNDEEVKKMCREVKAKYAKIRVLESNARDIEFKCPQCGASNAADAEFCSACGAYMTIDVHGAVENGEE